MTIALPLRERDRLQRLRALRLLDAEPEPLFDRLVDMAAAACDAPIALVSLVDAERQWFKAGCGLPGVRETPRDQAFCAHTILGTETMVVEDATLDARFADNPLVTGEPHIRFYAGVPLAPGGGPAVGTLCVIDRRPRTLTAPQQAQLEALAAVLTDALAMRQQLLAHAADARTAYEHALAQSESHHRTMLEGQRELISLATQEGRLLYVNTAYGRQFGLDPSALVGRDLFDLVDPTDREAVRAHFAELEASAAPARTRNRNVSRDGRARWMEWTNTIQRGADGALLVHSVGRDVTEQHEAEQALRASQSLLENMGRVAGVGGWAIDLATRTLTWTPQTYRLHEVDDDFVPDIDRAIEFYAPEARPVIARAVERGLADGTPWDVELPFVTARGRPRWVRAMGEVEFGHDGRPQRLVGAIQDITERREMREQLAERGRFLRQLADALPLRIAYIDPHQRYRFVNRAQSERFGRPPAAVVGFTRAELLGSTHNPELDRRAKEVLAGRPQVFEFEDDVQGRRRTIECRLAPDLADDGTARGFFVAGIDVTDRVHVQRRLQQQAALLQSVTETVPALVAVLGPDLRYRFVNGAYARWCRRDVGAILGRTIGEVLSTDDATRALPFAQLALQGEPAAFERQYNGHDGRPELHLAVQYLPLRLDDGSVDGFVCIGQDVTMHRLEQLRLMNLAQRDPLTGLLNRAGLQQQVDELAAGGPEASRTALVLLDLDRFKSVNDTHGHPVGDLLLQQVAERMRRALRPGDALARLGGDEFTLLLTGIDMPQALAVSHKLVAAMGTPFRIDGRRLHIGASAGVAMRHPGEDLAAWTTRADAALYEAKRAGRGRAVPAQSIAAPAALAS